MNRILKSLILLPWLLAAAGLTLHAQSVTVNWTKTHQTIDGFGASTADEEDPTDPYETGPMTSDQAQLFFSITNGVGLSLVRTLVPSDGSCVTVSSACANQVSDIQYAASYGARIWSSPWSPPASMKSNGATVCTNNAGLLTASYAAYATYLSNYIASVNSLNIPLYALSVQNEPDNCPSAYDGAIWSAANLDTFIKNNLGPTLAANGQTGVRLMMPETESWSDFANWSKTCMTDTACAAYVGINAWHDYDVASSITNPYSSSGKGFWETEMSDGPGFGPTTCGGCWDPSMTDALYWAGLIDNRIAVSNANAWNYWEFLDQSGDNEGLVFMGVAAQRLYVLGNYAKFVRPGWVRIDATHAPVSGLTVSAYKDPVAGGFAIVVTNQNSSSETITFSLTGFSASSVTPWTTSATQNLVQGTPLAASSSFTATVPPSSVTTFVGSGIPAPLAITTQTLPAGVVGTAYNSTVAATGGTPPYNWTASGLAPGLNINATSGQITGTPTTTGPYSETITVTDSATPTNASVSAVFSVTVTSAPPLTITTTSLAGGTVDKAYSASVAASGGLPPYTWSYSGLAPGLNLNAATGQITGTPTTAGPYSETITVTDSATPANTVSAVFSVTIAPPSAITFTTTSLPSGTVDKAYSTTVAAKGGVAPYAWSYSGLAPGLTLNATTGKITGTPTTAGPYSETITVTDSNTPTKATASAVFSVTIAPPPAITFTTTSLPSGTVGQTYSTTVAAKGGVAPYTWSYSGLAPGLNLNATTGQITGTPTTAGPYSETITVTDSDTPTKATASAVFAVTISAPGAITFTTTSLPSGTIGKAYSASVAVKGGVSPYTITGSSLPPGLSVSASGAITGTPTATGTYSATFTANDSASDTPATASFSIAISTAPTGPTIRVRAGTSTAYTDPSGNVWAADKYFSGGSTYSTTHAISNTTTQPLYQFERYNGFTYTFTGLPAGAAYTVTLKFAELYWTAAGERVFNVILNGVTVLSSFDIFKDAGGQYIADDKAFSTTVNASGQIVIQFQNGSADNAKVDAIQLIPGS